MKTLARTLAALTLGAAAALAPAVSMAWWNADWSTRAKVTLNTTAAGVETREAVNGLVVPVRLHSGNFDFAAAKEDGSDLRVVAADDKTPLPFVVERFDGINELALLWVPVAAVLPGSDKNVLHVYAGNANAAAEPAAAVFGNGHLLVAHFAETAGGAVDVVSKAAATPDLVPEPNGLLGGSASLAGRSIEWAASDRLKLADGGTMTASLWVKPGAAVEGSLLQWGPVKLGLAGGKATAEVGAVKLAGGELPPNAWVHLALTAGGGHVRLFVNGEQAAEAAGALPAVSGPVRVGEGFSGTVDELVLSDSLRSADWLRLAAAAQGSGGRFVGSVKENHDDPVAGEEQGHMAILVANLTTDAWVVIIILAVMFVLAGWVMVTKTLFVGRTDRDNRSFLLRFREARHDFLHLEDAKAHPSSSLYRLYLAGVRELNKRNVDLDRKALSGASLDAVKASVDADMVRESHHLNAKMVLLTIAISGGPFLGLLGTVAGVMITFAAIAAAGDVNINAIAPGIASALLATVAGLAVAIPALFGYNYLASRIKNISADMQIFVDEFVTRVAETYGQR